jgi:hypothetical protein
MSDRARYHCFYIEAVGLNAKYVCFDSEAEMLELVFKANSEWSGYRNLHVVYGRALEFEPAKVVEAWRVKGAS